MIAQLLIIAGASLVLALLVGWLGGRFLPFWPVSAVALVMAVLAVGALAFPGNLDFRGSMQAMVLGIAAAPAAVGVLVGGLIGRIGRRT
jgi:hypothetical protein